MEFDRSPIEKTLSRRSLLASARGVALGLVASAGRASSLGAPASQFQNPGEVAVATSAAISYLNSRASVTTTNAFEDVSKWVSPDRPDLIDFERNRFDKLGALGSAPEWNGIIERIWSDATVLDCSATSGAVHLSIRDWTGIQWRPAPVLKHRTREEEALAQRFPEKYGLSLPEYQLTDSGIGTRHDLMMVLTNRGWLVAKDGYEDNLARGTSPDYIVAPNSSNLIAATSSKELHATTPPSASKNSLGLMFDWYSAYQYGLYWAKSRNINQYTTFTNDCANFVSQCFKAGGYPNDDTWWPYTGAWVNNVSLRSWLLSSGRGYVSNEAALGYADIVNFDWTSDGVFDHVAIVTAQPTTLVSCHTTDNRNVTIQYLASIYSHPSFEFAGTHVYY